MKLANLAVFMILTISATALAEPPAVRPHAIPSDTGHYTGYYVGGGSAFRGHGPTAEEGTWGWDYSGWLLPRRITLLWSHGRRYQGGTGAYKTDGPRPAERITEAIHDGKR